MMTILTSALVVAALLASGTTASSQIHPRETLYSYNYFSDASHAQQVGYEQGVCYGRNPAYAGVAPLQGTATAYVVREEIGYCTPDGRTIYI